MLNVLAKMLIVAMLSMAVSTLLISPLVGSDFKTAYALVCTIWIVNAINSIGSSVAGLWIGRKDGQRHD